MPYLALLDMLMARFPLAHYPGVLDYGSGIGTSALRLAEAGYHITLADVPGKKLAYAQSRFRRRGYPFDTINVVDDRPRLWHGYDLLVCFDVLEHIPKPDRLIRHLAAALRPGGAAAIVATFVTYDSHPHHLVENSERVAPMWPLSLRLAGLDPVDKNLYRKASRRQVWLRRLRFRLWQATGLYVLHTRDPRYLQKAVT
jgi:cyclopropane fatty-acyl-phospholipid synthase-like methyltransferase